jgi:hypothetical protein
VLFGIAGVPATAHDGFMRIERNNGEERERRIDAILAGLHRSEQTAPLTARRKVSHCAAQTAWRVAPRACSFVDIPVRTAAAH